MSSNSSRRNEGNSSIVSDCSFCNHYFLRLLAMISNGQYHTSYDAVGLYTDKRALIKSASIFSDSSYSSSSKRMELETKRRRINVASASKLLTGGFKPSSWSTSAGSSTRKNSLDDMKERMVTYLSLTTCKEIIDVMTHVTKGVRRSGIKHILQGGAGENSGPIGLLGEQAEGHLHKKGRRVC
ncbi:hypothetical protein Tco_0550896 [Tanacetum coccineum]